LINNIKNDTTELSGLIDRNNAELKGIDSLMKISKSNFTAFSVQDSVFYYALRYTISLHLFEFNDLTLVQLRNAGGYSLIKADRVADSIALYESKNNDIKLQEKFVADYYVQTATSLKQVFDVTITSAFFQTYQASKKIPSDMHVLITKDPEKINLLYNNCWTFSIVVNGYKNLLRDHFEYLKRFIVFLKKSYDIE
jgi:hypothetical protein